METNTKTATFIMVAVDLETPVSLGSVIDTGEITYDSHITLLTAKGMSISGEEVPMKKEWLDLLKKNEEDYDPIPVLSLFELDLFKGADNDSVVLRLKKETALHKELSAINSALCKEFKVKEEYKRYNPHLTLAKLPKEHEDFKIISERLMPVLRDSIIMLEDYVLSESDMEEYKDFKKQNLTPYNGVARFFRERELMREGEEE